MDQDVLVSITEAARLKKRTRATIYRWLNDGRLKRRYRNGLLVVSATELAAIKPPVRGRPRATAR